MALRNCMLIPIIASRPFWGSGCEFYFIFPSLVLWAVVCNAGIFTASAFDWGEKRGVNVLRNILETNTIGAVRTINSFIPLLRKTANSRVVITSSIAGNV